jgi:predicted TIM-barrel fold metal-dependent hydrolase
MTETAGFRGVDAHAHVMRRDAPLAAQRHSAPKRDVTVEEYLAVLDRHGLHVGLP